jgi:hypothetical protein
MEDQPRDDSMGMGCGCFGIPMVAVLIILVVWCFLMGWNR